MPSIRKITAPPATTPKKKRGRPVGSKNKPKYATIEEPEVLYIFIAKDGCTIESSLPKAEFWCKHYYPMKRAK